MSEAQPMRASDAEREQTATRLRAAGGEGRLDVDELEERLERAYAAKTGAELDTLTADLPRRIPGDAPERTGDRRLRHAVQAYVPLAVLLIVIWAASGGGYFWPIWPMIGWAFMVLGPWRHQRRHGRHRARQRQGQPPAPPGPPGPPGLPPAP